MYAELLPSELKDLKRFEKILISKKTTLFKKVIMHEKVRFAKTKGNIYKIQSGTQNACNILTKPKDLIVVKLNRGLKYGDHVYFELYIHVYIQGSSM